MIKLIASCTLVFLISVSIVDETKAMVCTRRNLLGSLEQFTCPNNVLELKASYCCGTEANRYCCKKSKAREHNYRNNLGSSDGLGKSVAKGIGITLIIILVVICGCIGLCCYCVCNMFRKKTTSHGSVLGGIGGGGSELAGQSVHVVNQPTGQGYPSQQPGGYPSAGYPAAQPGYPSGQPGYPSYPAYQQAPPPSMYPTASYPMAQSSAPPPYPMEQQPPYNPNYPG